MRKRIFLTALAAVVAPLAHADPDYSLFNESIVGVTNSSINGYIGTLAFDFSTDGTPSSASTTASFGGKRRDGTDGGTMTFSGATHTSSQYGALHVYATGMVTNSFFNAANPVYYDDRTNTFDPNGTPDGLASLCFAGFTDTLQFGGSLQSGYVARYVFHIDGTNAGVIGDYGLSAASAGLAVNVGTESDGFGFYDAVTDQTVGTKGFAVDGTNAQRINVQFSAQFVGNTVLYADGEDYSGTSDFSSTASLAGIVLYDASGRVIPSFQWSVTSSSGTVYARLNAVPEPASLLALAAGTLAVLRRRARRSP